MLIAFVLKKKNREIVYDRLFPLPEEGETEMLGTVETNLT
jgi:hypothetical protein